MHIGLLGTEELTYRRFRALLFRLPRESLFMQAHLSSEARWSTDNYLQAQVIDAVNLLRVQLLQVKGAKPKPKFEPFPRPGDDPDKGKRIVGRGDGVSLAEIRDWLALSREEVSDGSGS